MCDLLLRPLGLDDARSVADLLNAARASVWQRTVDTTYLRNRWETAGARLEQRGAFGPAGELIGVASVQFEDASDDGAARVTRPISLALHPAAQATRPRLAHCLLEWCEKRALARPLASVDLTLALQVDVMVGDAAVEPLLASRGYALTNSTFTMLFDAPNGPDALPVPGVAIAGWAPERSRDVWLAAEAAFDAPGRQPRGYDEFTRRFQHAQARPDWWRLAIDEARDQVAGFAILDQAVQGNGALAGWIDVLGVRPEWRRKGVGQALLAAAIRTFRAEAGIQPVLLDVASDNPSGAQRLYERVGFRVAVEKRSYGKRCVTS